MLGNNILIGAAGAGGATGHIIEGSGLFDGSSGFLSRTPSSAGDNNTWTWSGLVKRNVLGAQQNIFGAGTGTADETTIQFLDGDTLRFFHRESSTTRTDVTTTQLFRDPSAWIHLVVAVDMSQATASNRIRMYANGTEITDFGTDTRDAQNSDTHINKTNLHVLGVRISTSSSFINMYVANAILIDGLQLDPTSFGEVTDDGFWQINDASGLTFGTNGFLIEGGVNMAAGTDSLTTGVDAVVNIGDSAGDWSGNTGSYSFGNGAGNEIKATVNDDAIYSNHVFSGDFDFDVGAYDIVMGEMGVFASDEVGTFLGADTNGNLDAMTNSFWIERGGAGGADRAFIGSVSEGALSHTDGANYRIERRSGTITLYKNDVSLHVFTSTYTGSMALFFGNGNTLFEAVDVTYTDFVGGNNFFKTGTITATNDSPTNDADNGYGNYATFNPLIPDTNAGTPVYTDGNRHFANASGTGYCGASTLAINSGKFYVEIKPNTFVNDEEIIGFALASSNVWGSTAQLGNASGQGAGLHTLSTSDTKLKIDGGSLTTVDTRMLSPDRTIIAIDSEAGKGWLGFYDNSGSVSRWVDTSGTTRTTDQPAAGTNATWTFTANEAVLVGSSLYGDGNTDIYADSGDWLGTPPSGFVSMGTQNLPTPDVINYEDEYYIEAGISHTNGATTAVTLPTSVSGGAMARIKRTDSTGGWYVVDTVRGANKFTFWDSAAAEDTSTFTDQNLTGTTLTLPSALATGTYMIEVFYQGSYFQMKTYSGNSANRTISFDGTLDTAPGFMFPMERTGTDAEHLGYHISTGNTGYLQLQTTSAFATGSAFLNNTSPTTTQFTLGTMTNVNKTGNTYICYAWANSGPYAFGSYTGNANADGPMINVGGMPQQFFVKSTVSADSWSTKSFPIQGYNVQNDVMYMDLTNANYNGADLRDFLSTGWKMRDTNGNGSGNLYIYGAFGIQPLTDGSVNQGRAGAVPPFGQANGGTITQVGAFWVHTFTSSGTFTPAIDMDVEYLVIAGGGSGGIGGGGAGGYRTATGFSVNATSYPITVGAGGTRNTTRENPSGSGTNSVFSTITAAGGGGGGGYNGSSALAIGLDGGSSGGGGTTGGDNTGTAAGTATPSGQGNTGGTGNTDDSTANGGGGGGGAGAVGGNCNNSGTPPGAGGNGLASSITGSSVTRAGGGGGFSNNGTTASGGTGGGTASVNGAVSVPAVNLGAGSGGTAVGTNRANGGTGVVIIKYAIS